MRLFLQRFLIALKQALTDPQAGISICMIAHLALWAEAERGARGVALYWLALVVANDRSVAAMTLSARIARIHATGDDTGYIPGFVFRVVEDTPFHEVRRVSYCLGANTSPFAGAGCPGVQTREYSPAVLARTGQCARSPGARCVHQRA